jgi:cysteine desulfurase / selenocysteine lyase
MAKAPMASLATSVGDLSATRAAYDVDAIRADFPILRRKVHGRPLVYLDNGASAQKPKAMLDAVMRGYGDEYANVHRGLHYLSNLATANYEKARETVRRFVNAKSDEEIIFTRNATEGINLVAQSYGATHIGEGDEIVLSIMEHHSNIVPWHFLRERQGAVLKWAPVSDTGEFLLDKFEALLGTRTKMVAITHMSNVLGTIVPIKEVVRLAHARGIPVLVDGAQGAVHLPVDVQDLDVDFYSFTGHKLYGPTGIGVLYGKKAHLEAMPPYQGGGEMIGTVACDAITYGKLPHRFEAGTPAIVQAIGLAASIDYVEGVGRVAIKAHEDALTAYAMEPLGELNWLRIFGHAKDKGSIISFEMGNAHAHDVSTILDRYGVAVRAGTHCAEPLLARFGVTSTCRASFAMYNTVEEVDHLVEALQKAHEMFA